MIMTLEEYIKNPMGKNNAVFSQRELFKNLYTQKFDAIFAREAGRITYRLYKDSDRRYIIHLKIPSEVVEKFYYDVVLEFTTTNSTVSAENSLKDYEVKFFSNDPAFVYTYAYSFDKNKLFVEDLKPRMSKQALTEKAVIKNPKNVIGYVKSIYFAYLFIKLRGLDKKAIWLAEGVKYIKKDLLSFVEDADRKIEERQVKGEQVEKKKRLDKKSVGNKVSDTVSRNTSKMVKTVSTTGSVNSSKHSNIKSAKTVKHTKTTKRK